MNSSIDTVKVADVCRISCSNCASDDLWPIAIMVSVGLISLCVVIVSLLKYLQRKHEFDAFHNQRRW